MSVNTGVVDLTLVEARERINCYPPATPDLLLEPTTQQLQHKLKPTTQLPQMEELTKYLTGFA